MSGDQSAGLQGPLEPGQKVGFGRYTLTRFLGKGGMGVVWLARDERLEEELALKFLAGEISHDAEALGDMRRETLKSRKLSHPNIIRIHDLFEGEGELPFISMEFIDGKALNTFKAEQPHRLFSWEYLMRLIRQLCAALDYAHGQKIIHRDLKPGNMMVDSTGALKLADFGLAASAADSMSRLSKDLGSSGTPPYMSPQQLRGQPPRVADDIYSLGATLYELLTSKPPFYTGDIPYQVREEAPTPMDQRLADLELDNQIPDDVAALVMACLAKQPEQRPPSAAAVAEWIGLELNSTGSVSAWSSPAEVESVDEEAVTVPAVLHEQADAPPEDPENEPASERSSGGAWKWGAIVMALLIVGLGAMKFIPDREQGQPPKRRPTPTRMRQAARSI
jgi:serine/threonine protein kinase